MRPSTGRTANMIRIRVSDEELAIIQELSKGYKNMSEYIRLKVLCDHPKCPVKTPEERTKIALETVQKQLNRNRGNVA